MKARKANVGGRWVAIERGLLKWSWSLLHPELFGPLRHCRDATVSERRARLERPPEKLIEKAA
jgi:hypothetical protein